MKGHNQRFPTLMAHRTSRLTSLVTTIATRYTGTKASDIRPSDAEQEGHHVHELVEKGGGVTGRLAPKGHLYQK